MKKTMKKGWVLSLILGTMLVVGACGAKAPAEESEAASGGERPPVVVPEGEPELTFTGSTVAAFGPMAAVLDCYEEGTVILNVDYASRESQLQGTWEKKDGGASITIEDATYEVEEAADGSMAFEYKTFDGKGEAVIPFTTAE